MRLSSATSIDWTIVLGVLALALVLRVVCLERSHLIGADSSRFLRAAEFVEQGHFSTAVQDSFHPFTSFATAGVNRIQTALLGAPDDFRSGLERRERAGHFVVMLTGLFLVWSLMCLVAQLFPGLSPVVVGVLVACQPYFVRSSADIMSDMPCLAFFVFALWQGAVATTERSVRPIVLAGAAVGLSYLARPEGLVAALAIALYWLARDHREWPRLVARGALFAAVTAVVMLPYVAAISSASGRPTLTMKKSTSSLIGIPKAGRPGEGARVGPSPRALEAWQALPPKTLGESGEWGDWNVPREAAIVAPLSARALWKIFLRWYTTAPEVIAVAFAIGWVGARRRRDWRDGRLYLGICAGLVTLMLFRLMQIENDPGYIVKRHVYLLVALTLPFAAHGLTLLGSWLDRRLGTARTWRAGVAPVALVTIVAIVLGVRAVAARRLDDMAQLEAANWILEHYGHGEVIFTDREKLPYYAGGQWRPLGGDAATVLGSVQAHDRAWVAFYPDRLRFVPGLRELAERPASGLRLVQSFDEPEKGEGSQLALYIWERH
jgi:hypothetical protein